MILVITPGSWSHVYPPLLHAAWHGWTPTDLVFPFFMFIIGSAMFFSFRKVQFQASQTVISRIAVRSLVIFLLGLALNAFPTYETFESLRFMSVLGRIGIAYGVAALTVLFLNSKQIFIVSAIILVGYWLTLWFLGGAEPYSLDGNFVRSVDLFILGEGHMWKGKGIPFDPEGMLSTLPSIVSIFVGFEATRMLNACTTKQQAIKRLLICSAVAFVIGYAWHLQFPINKYLWTSSYVMVSSAVALSLLALFIWLIDIRQQTALVKPLLVYGRNALFIYVFAAVWTDCYKLITLPLTSGEQGDFRDWAFESLSSVFSSMNASLVYALIHVILFWLACLILHKKNIVIKL